MKIEFGALRLGATARKNILECLDANWITAGPKVRAFEDGWGRLFDYPHNYAVSSGTDACLNMCLSLYDFGARPGDEIITPALSFIATANAIRAAGFVPKFVDIKRETLNIDEDLIEAAVTPRTRAVMAVHTMGRPCAMDVICDIATRCNLRVLEDACEAHGARYRGRYVGTFGHAAAFSFYTAHLICAGEGGMVSTMHADVADVLRSTRSHGRANGDLYFDFPRFGLNSKMNDLEASVGLEGIENFWETFGTRWHTMRRVHDAVRPFRHMIDVSEEDASNTNCPHGYSITLKDPKLSTSLKAFLGRKSIHWKRNFGSIPTQHASFSHLGYRLGAFPKAEYVGANGIHFGIHQYLSDDDVAYVCDALVEFMTHAASGRCD